MKPLVSVLIAAYNAEKWIEESIRSALAQDWPSLEIIIVNDGSEDATLRIAKGFESGNVKVLSQENLGASAARNKALSLAQGEYIQWLDADDILAPDKISRQMEGAESGLHSRILLSSSFGCFYKKTSQAFFRPTSLWQDLEPAEWIYRKFMEYTWMSPVSWLVSRYLTEESGPWDESLSLDDDGEYFARVVKNCSQVQFCSEAVNYHRVHAQGLSRRKNAYACRSLLKSMKLCIGYLLELEDSPRTRKAALQYLQDWYIYFYPEKKKCLRSIHEKASALGGTLSPPNLDWEYRLIKPLVGWKGVKRAMGIVSDSKLLLHGCRELLKN